MIEVSDEELRELSAELTKLRGLTAILWTYTVSHSQLEVRFALEPGSNWHLVCEATRWVQGPTSWPQAELAVTRDSEAPHLLRIADARSSFLVVCGAIQLKKNVLPLH